MNYKKIFFSFAFVFALFTSWFVVKKGSNYFLFYGDALGYYIYLPAYLKYDKLLTVDELEKDTFHLGNVAHEISNFKNHYPKANNGFSVIQYTYMNAALHAPLFLGLHVIDKLFNIHSTGFELRYVIALRLTEWIYLLIGCFLLYKLLMLYSIDRYLIYTYLLIGVFATNIYWFVFAQNGMSHIVLFFLVSLLLYSTVKLFYQNDIELSRKYLIGLIFSTLTIAVLRPSDLLFVLVVPFYNICSIDQFKSRIVLLFKHWKVILTITIPLALFIFTPQFLYWKSLTGSFLFNSYGNQSFDWLHPKIRSGLFYACNGWYMYTPFMLLPTLFCLIKIDKTWRVVVWILFPLYVYVIYSWWCFNYINGFGSRPMIHIYPLLLIVFILAVSKLNKWYQLGVLLFSILTIVINLNFSIKQYEGKLLSQQSSFSFNYSTFFKQDLSVNDLYTLDLNYVQNTSAKEVRLLNELKFDTLPNGYYINEDYSEFSPFAIECKIDTKFKPNNRLMIQGSFMSPNDLYDIYSFSKIVLSVKRGEKEVSWRAVAINNKLGKNSMPDTKNLILNTNVNCWDTIRFFTQSNEIEPGDEIKIYVWNSGRQKIAIKKIEVMEVE